jgi:hypothetical protein
MATSKIQVTEGSGKNIATNSITEDAVTKDIQRIVLNDSTGTEIDPLSQSDFDSKAGSLTETAPASDTASSGLNGRLQRIAQRLTTLIGSTISTSIADGSAVTLGAKADAKSTATDTTAITIMSVLKQISASVQAPPSQAVTGIFWQSTQPVSLASVPSHAVTNAGTFAVQNTPTIPTAIFNGKKTVTTAGTRVTLASTQAVRSVVIKALVGNTGTIYVGNSTVASTNGFALSPGDSISLDIADLTTVNLDASVSGEGVTYIATN